MNLSSNLAFSAHVPLAPRTTLRVGGPARAWIEAHDDATLRAVTRDAYRRESPCFLLGGGSNVVIADDGIDGVVVGIATLGVSLRREHAGSVLVDAAAGEPWDALVERCVGEGLAGLECLAGIPGQVGATPVQNVGAYGQAVSDHIAAVRVYWPARDREEVLPPAACRFAYRDSIFKHVAEPVVILGVTFRLRAGPSAPVRYAELARALTEYGNASLTDIRATVLALRSGKGMLADATCATGRSVGSFFTNPILPTHDFHRVATRLQATGLVANVGAIPTYEAGPDRIKLPAAWLIERAGVRKGERWGGAAISPLHALAIVNEDNASAADIITLAASVRARVYAATGVTLTPEPVLVGFPAGTLTSVPT